jgi:hypothetical protein
MSAPQHWFVSSGAARRQQQVLVNLRTPLNTRRSVLRTSTQSSSGKTAVSQVPSEEWTCVQQTISRTRSSPESLGLDRS